jgi:hypothetical protein
VKVEPGLSPGISIFFTKTFVVTSFMKAYVAAPSMKLEVMLPTANPSPERKILPILR